MFPGLALFIEPLVEVGERDLMQLRLTDFSPPLLV